MIKYFCDICGKEVTKWSEVSEFKIKKKEHSWHESWWEKMLVHKACWEKLCEKIGLEELFRE